LRFHQFCDCFHFVSPFRVVSEVTQRLPFFVPTIVAIAQTDLILTVPRKLAQMTAPIARIRGVEAPREIKAFP
jgi:hypothetical protein